MSLLILLSSRLSTLNTSCSSFKEPTVFILGFFDSRAETSLSPAVGLVPGAVWASSCMEEAHHGTSGVLPGPCCLAHPQLTAEGSYGLSRCPRGPAKASTLERWGGSESSGFLLQKVMQAFFMATLTSSQFFPPPPWLMADLAPVFPFPFCHLLLLKNFPLLLQSRWQRNLKECPCVVP